MVTTTEYAFILLWGSRTWSWGSCSLFQPLGRYRDDFKNNEKRKATNPQLFLLNNPGIEQRALVLVAAK